MMLPVVERPPFTSQAPVTTTSTRPMLRVKLVSGFDSAITLPACSSMPDKSSLTASKRCFSRGTRERALMTRTPVIFSCTVRTSLSSTPCWRVYSGTETRVMRQTNSEITGSVATSTRVRKGSIIRVITMPPTSRMGALTPMRWMRLKSWLRL